KRTHDATQDATHSMVGLDIDSPLDGCVDGEGEGGGWMLNHVTQSADNFVQNQQAEIKRRNSNPGNDLDGSYHGPSYTGTSGQMGGGGLGYDLDGSYHGPSYTTSYATSTAAAGYAMGRSLDSLGVSQHGYPSVNYQTSYEPYAYGEGGFPFAQQYAQQPPGAPGMAFAPQPHLYQQNQYQQNPNQFQGLAFDPNQFQGQPPISTQAAGAAPATRKKGSKTTRKKSSTSKANTTVNGVKVCRILGCDDLAIARRPYCLRHSGSRQCEFIGGCTKCAQGSTRFCIAHGGGRRCTFVGCDKGARDKYFCAAHGGGKRCCVEGCNKSAVGGSAQCTSHGGGKRCKVQGCDKSAQSSTNFCVRHGGGKKCSHVDGATQRRCDKVARGRTDYCASHGGGVRCKLESCNRVAIGKLQLCRAHGQQNTQMLQARGLMPGQVCLPLGGGR
ncbi:hypothetical protein TrRE_jg1779, partial [Triparma retinervis]